MLEHMEIDAYQNTRAFPKGFNWITVLKDIIDGAELTYKDETKLEMMAGNWPTCACGQLCQVLPRGGANEPLDRKLYDLGIFFFNQINNREWSKALTTFYKIEARTAELLKQVESKKKSVRPVLTSHAAINYGHTRRMESDNARVGTH